MESFFIMRKGNTVAHSLASFGKSNGFVSWTEVGRDFLLPLLLADVCSFN